MKRNLVRTHRCTSHNETSDWRVNPIFIRTALFVVLTSCIWSDSAYAEELHSEIATVFGFDMAEGWLDPPVHSHFSPGGTPMIHSFRTEPAFTRRDLLLDYNARSETGRNEQEIGIEVEWPISYRLGLIFEIPYVFVDSDDGGTTDGFGNLAVSPRVLVAEYERFLLAFGLEVETTTGKTDGGIAEEEVALAPSFSTWIDLGHWWTVNAQSGLECSLESSDTEFFFRSALIHTFGSDGIHDSGHVHHDHADDLSPGLLSVILEADLAVGLSGEEDGNWFAEGIVGVLVSLWDNADMRVGYQFPLSRSQDLNNGVTGGLIWHFK
ncbi:MAG: hypothetical protein ACYTFW_06995 [Planctomycetota bacterium]|jgi:hypothetical protein